MTTVLHLDVEKHRPALRELLDRITADPKLLDPRVFLEQAAILAAGLPDEIRATFYGFRRHESHSALHVTGSPVLTTDPGPTPTGYVEEQDDFRLNDAQLLHGLYAVLLGEPIGYVSQRKGACYNTIAPMPELAAVANSSSGHLHDFGFHIEDAFHPTRPDYLGLACIRNDERAGTTIADVDGLDQALTADEIAFLFEKRFPISHNPIHYTSGVVDEERQPVLFGHPERPYVRVNFAALDWAGLRTVERDVLLRLQEHFEKTKKTLVLGAGEFVYVNNYTTAHARDAYEALPPGRSRWLSRLCVMTDLRKSSHRRDTIESRAILA
ncbi:TauD/TfdA family dioxygenase [Kitasatospora sp. NPDC088391]|uniref:TauD/TfdA family dioxygenase n=1 Tax=Kitasatospora sp. NPDC088391 TaxID=3364074 RepID=UPI0037FB8481